MPAAIAAAINTALKTMRLTTAVGGNIPSLLTPIA